MKRCYFCDAPLDDDALFCGNCGKKVEPQGYICPQCGSAVDTGSLFCARCGFRLDLQQNNEVSAFDVQKENKKTWLYVICGVIAAVLLLFGGLYIYRTYVKQDVTFRAEEEEISINKTQRRDEMNNRKGFDDSEECTYEVTDFNDSKHNRDVTLSTEEKEYFIYLVHLWDDYYNNNRKIFDPSGENCPYADIVKLYGKSMKGCDAAEFVHKVLMSKPDFWQKSTNIIVTKITDKRVRCDFKKHTSSNGKTNVFPSYLVLIDEYEGIWRIAVESDSVTDANLRKNSHYIK